MKKIAFVITLAMIVLFSAFFVSSSLGGPAEPEIIKPNEKLIGLDINKNMYIDYETAFQDAISTGIDFTEITLSWEDIEISEGVYNDDILDIINLYYPSYNMKIALTFNIIDTVSMRTPEYLLNKDLSDPLVQEAFLSYLEHVLEKVKDVELVAVSIGNEVDGYLQGEEWQAFEVLFESSKELVEKEFPKAVVGTKVMYEGVQKPEVKSLLGLSDVLMLTYYPIKDTLFIKSNDEIELDLKAIMETVIDKPIYMMEVGMPTSEKLASSESKQSEFIELIFKYLNDYDHFELISINWLNDRDELELMTFVEYYGLEDAKFYEYLSSLGLKDKEGKNKKGFDTFKVEVAKLSGENNE